MLGNVLWFESCSCPNVHFYLLISCVFVHYLTMIKRVHDVQYLMCRGRVVGAVQSLVVSEINRRKLLFVLHVDGNLRVWDLHGHVKVLNFNVGLLQSSGNSYDLSLFLSVLVFATLLFQDFIDRFFHCLNESRLPFY